MNFIKVITLILLTSSVTVQAQQKYSKREVRKFVKTKIENDYNDDFDILSMYSVGSDWKTTGYRIA